MADYTFKTDGNKEEIANIIERQLMSMKQANCFDVEKETEQFTDEQGDNCYRVYILETDNEAEESFSHEITVEEIATHEYRADLKLEY